MTTRKIQAEIDKVAKKIQEGTDLFDEILAKMESSTNPNMTHKYETALKTEIKKLQRNREQMKQFSSLPEVKNKDFVDGQKRFVETYMEKFKTIEKESKTKAFSKEGLMQSEKIDPLEKEKKITSSWIKGCVDKLQTQIDALEAEAESLGYNPKKKKDAGKARRNEEIRTKVDRHKYHIGRLELILRMLENDHITCEKANTIKDDVLYYVDENGEDDFEEQEYIYEDLHLDEEESLFEVITDSHALASALEEKEEEKPYSEFDKKSKSAKVTPKPEEKVGFSPQGSQTTKSTSTTPKAASLKIEDIKSPPIETPTDPLDSSRSAKKVVLPQTKEVVKKPEGLSFKKGSKDSSFKSDDGHEDTRSLAQVVSAALPSKSSDSVAQKLKSDLPPNSNSSLSARPTTPQAPQSAPTSSGAPNKAVPLPSTSASVEIKASQVPPKAPTQIQKPLSNSKTAVKAPEEQQRLRDQKAPSSTPVVVKKPQPQLETQASREVLLPAYLVDLEKSLSDTNEKSKYYTEIILKVKNMSDPSPKLTNLSLKAKSYFEGMLDTGFRNNVNSLDIDPPLQYTPSNPLDLPSYYPCQPLASLLDPRLVEVMDPDTLFFIFHYQKGSYQQYLVTKQLHKTWKFNTKFNMWFKRASNPIETTPQFEKGAFTFFDYNETWTERTEKLLKVSYSEIQDPLV